MTVRILSDCNGRLPVQKRVDSAGLDPVQAVRAMNMGKTELAIFIVQQKCSEAGEGPVRSGR